MPTDVKRAVEKFWVDELTGAGLSNVFAGKADGDLDNIVTPFIVCRCGQSPTIFPGSAAYRIDPFEILVISHINEQNSEEHSETIFSVLQQVEFLSFPQEREDIEIAGIGPVTTTDAVSEDDERYADIVSFVCGAVVPAWPVPGQ